MQSLRAQLTEALDCVIVDQNITRHVILPFLLFEKMPVLTPWNWRQELCWVIRNLGEWKLGDRYIEETERENSCFMMTYRFSRHSRRIYVSRDRGLYRIKCQGKWNSHEIYDIGFSWAKPFVRLLENMFTS